MKAVARSLCAAVAIAICTLSGAQGTGANAFLTRPARTTSQLVAQVLANPRVRDSYERHFQLDLKQLVTFLKTLRPSALTADKDFTIYGVPTNGELRSHEERLKKGELVFVDMNGNAILRAKCGNPLVGGPEGVVELNPPVSEHIAHEKPIEIPATQLLAITLIALQPDAVSVPEKVEVAQTRQEEEKQEAGQPLPVVGGVSWLPLIGVPVIAGSFQGGDLGGGGGVGPPVPDPATILALGTGLGYFGLRSKARKARRNSSSALGNG